MMRVKALAAWMSLGLLSAAASSHAATVTVTQGDVANAPALNQWYLTNYRDVTTGPYTSNTVAAITSNNARSGNGSLEMSSTDGTGKADYAYTWGFVNGNTLGNLTSLSLDWYRSGTSTNPAAQAPALRLLVDADGSAATTNDRAYLVWEKTYQNDPTVAIDTWVSSNILNDDFWQRNNSVSPGVSIEQYDIDLSEWAGGASFTNSIVFNRNSAVLGIEVGIGGGWNGNFRGFIDNVTYGFGTAPATTFNFEANGTAVPEPMSIALVGLGLLAMAGTRRRR